MGRTRFPPANSEYLIAWWIEVGGAFSAGINRSNCVSTAMRSSSKKSGSFISGLMIPVHARRPSRSVVAFRFKRLGGELSIGFLQQNLHASFRFFELLLALARKPDTLFE